ncbi:MAG: M28 family metallopeptidase [Gemmatimonadaceae bacterium]
MRRSPLLPTLSALVFAVCAAVLNMDMIGCNEKIPDSGGAPFRGLTPQTAQSNANALNIVGSSRTPELAADIQAANTPFTLTIRLRYDNNESNLLRRSDQWPFLNNHVPAVWFFTGLHPDYHRPSDVADKLNYEKMTRIVKLLHATSWNLANADGRPAIEPMDSRPRM